MRKSVDLKNTQCEICELSFIWGKVSEDCSPGDSTSDSSEKLQRSSKEAGGNVCTSVILVKREYMQSST